MIWTSPPDTLLTSYERQVGAWIVSGDEIHAGDVLVLLGTCIRIDEMKPYEGTILAGLNARDAWAEGRALIPIEQGAQYRILPRPGGAK